MTLTNFAENFSTISYVASDGRCYGLDITSDQAVGQRFSTRSTQQSRTGAQLMTAGFLLNSKAWAFLTRAGPDMREKKANDANDIIFIVNYMRKNHIYTNRHECRWVVDYDFWTTFCTQYEGAEGAFQAINLQRDATPSSSNREARNSTGSIRSRTSSR